MERGSEKVKRWAIDEITAWNQGTGPAVTVGYVEAPDQQTAMKFAADRGLFGTGLYAARPALKGDS